MPAPKRNSVGYTLAFAGGVALVCAILVASSAVLLRPRQERNQRIDRLAKVLTVAGLAERDERLTPEEVEARFAANVVPRAVDLATGAYTDAVDPAAYDQRAAMRDPDASVPAAENPARVLRRPNVGVVYEVRRGGELGAVIVPIQGYGLWSTMYGYLALEADGGTVAGITFYEHGETPGLGGEIENAAWQAKWAGRRVFGPDGEIALEVLKGPAGSPAEDPYHVDGLSGATITSRGVTSTLAYWLGPDAFGPYLDRVRGSSTQDVAGLP